MTTSQDSVLEHSTECDGSRCMIEYLSRYSGKATSWPIVICFHGSGTDSLRPWEDLLEDLSQRYRTVLFDRGPRNPSPQEHIKILWTYLMNHGLTGPFVLVAHSYGGLFAKHFLHSYHASVGGMVLAETGKGGAMDGIQVSLLKKPRLGSKPLSVIRANSFLQQRQALRAGEGDKGTEEANRAQLERMEWLKRCEEEDEKLEKEQLKLSNNSKLVHLPNCGHNVVQDRPDVVLQEVQWVVKQYEAQRQDVSWLKWVRRFSLHRHVK